MWCIEILLLLISLTYSGCVWMPTIHRVDLRDEKIFEIVPENNEEEDNENEIIQPDESFVAEHNDDRYKPLHTYIARFNRRAIDNSKEEIPFFMDDKEVEDVQPYVIGYKKDLDELYRRTAINLPIEKGYDYAHVASQVKDFRSKRSDDENKERTYTHIRIRADKVVDSFKKNKSQFSSPATDKVTEEVSAVLTQPMQRESSSISRRKKAVEDVEDETDEVAYDYERFKREYDQLLQDRAKDIFNYTDKGATEKDVNDVFKKLVDVKKPSNCTKEELAHIGFKSIKCLIHDYKHAKDKTTVKKLFRRTWLVLKIWICIYICVAVPCWCHRGWCCCCCRCKFCFPRKRIAIAKKYYTVNVPGKLIRDFLKPYSESQDLQITTYKPTGYEEDAYEDFGAVLRNL